MNVTLKKFGPADINQALTIWNQILEEGDSFPNDNLMIAEELFEWFDKKTEVVCLFLEGELAGFYTLNPNNLGRCSHIANAGYAVKREYRGSGLGKILLKDSLDRAQQNGFKGLQFNAVVASNHAAIRLYLQFGFSIVGTIHNGFRLKDDSYSDTLIFLKTW